VPTGDASRRVERPQLDVATFVAEKCGAGLEFRVLAGQAGLANVIQSGRIQKLSLALTGFTRQIRTGRLQIVGETEIQFCAGLGSDQRRQVFSAACQVPVTAFLITKGLEPPPELLEQADRHAVPVLWCAERSSAVIDTVQRYLEDRLAPRMRVHGVLLDVFGLGVLLRGDAVIGKSECALEMIQRGHRLVADDVVEVRQISSQILVGACTERLGHFMELRGIGIISIADLFGVAAIRYRKRVELIVRLVNWAEDADYERLGLDDRRESILGVPIPLVELPVASGRNLAILLEVAARVFMLKQKGFDPARTLVDRLDAFTLQRATGPPMSPIMPGPPEEEEDE
jgi:HPr kinase/phosphorylase